MRGKVRLRERHQFRCWWTHRAGPERSESDHTFGSRDRAWDACHHSREGAGTGHSEPGPAGSYFAINSTTLHGSGRRSTDRARRLWDSCWHEPQRPVLSMPMSWFVHRGRGNPLLPVTPMIFGAWLPDCDSLWSDTHHLCIPEALQVSYQCIPGNAFVLGHRSQDSVECANSERIMIRN
jgi:hypothetical protein